MLIAFWCQNCRINTTLNPPASRCPRCGAGRPLDAYYPGQVQMGKNTYSVNRITMEAPIYGVGTNFRLGRSNSGTRLNSPGVNKNVPGANN